MSEGREQDQPEERDSAARPVTAAARRERRASARPAGRKDSRTSDSDDTEVSKGSKAAKDSDSDADAATKKGRPTRARDGQEKRVGLFSKGFRYIREVISELRKVIWPTRKQLVTYTAVVLVFVVFMVAVVFGLDQAFGWAVFELFA